LTTLDKVVLGIACTAALLSVVSFVICWLNWSRQRFLLSMRAEVTRFARIEESVVRSVMEEGGEAAVEAKLRTVERLRKAGFGPGEAVDQALRLHRKVSQ